MNNFIRAGALLLAGLTSAFGATLTVLPDTNSLFTGQTLTVEIQADAPDLFSYMLDVQYPLFLALQSVTAQGTFGAWGIGIAYDASVPGTLTLVNDALILPGFTGPETLFTIEFEAIAEGTGEIRIDPLSVVLVGLDTNFDVIDIPLDSVSAASVVVTAQQSPVDVPEVSSGWMALLGVALCLMGRQARRG
ncbi:MAG: hypothetical protein JNK87_01450 [Bryobacterales bacterium]|nr:hypothetical protein [Bryobacterales bacterium]